MSKGFLGVRVVGKTFISLVIVAISAKALGLLREIAVARKFGAGEFTDHFFIAWILPMVLGNLISQVAASATVPMIHKNDVDRRRVFLLFFLSVGLMTLLMYIFSGAIVKLFAPGFRGDAYRETLILFKGLIPAFFFLASIGPIRGELYAEKKFVLPSLGVIFFNGIFIMAILLWATSHPVESLLVGADLGAMFFWMLLYFIWLKSSKNSAEFPWRESWKQFKGLLGLTLSIFVAVGASYLNRIIDRSLASFLNSGDVSHLYFGERIMWIPIEIFIWALGTSVFPFLSMDVATGHSGAMVNKIKETLGWAWMFVVPASLLLFFFPEKVISIIYGGGNFNADSVKATARVLSLYSVGIFAIAGNAIIFKALYAFQAKILLLKVAILSVVMNLILDIILMKPLGVAGIALSTSVVEIVSLFYLTFAVRSRDKSWKLAILFSNMIIFLPITLLVGTILWLSREFYNFGSLNILQLLVVAIMIYGVYFASFTVGRKGRLGIVRGG